MPRFWIKDKEFDRWVLRAVRAQGGSVEDVMERTKGLLAEAGLIKSIQKMPDDIDVWCALQRLTGKGRIRKTVSDGVGARYWGSYL